MKSAFQAALDVGIRDSALLHHFALLLADQEQFDDADRYAQDALAVLDDSRARVHFKTESRQNLHNTLGMIAAKHALKEATVGAADRRPSLRVEWVGVCKFPGAGGAEVGDCLLKQS